MQDLTEADCREALLADPHNPAAHLRLGQLALERGGWAEAESHFRSLCERLEEASGPLLMLGEVLQLQGRVDEAESALNWTALGLFYLSSPPNLELDGENAEAYFYLPPWHQLKQPQAARDFYLRAWWDQLGGLYLDDLLEAALAQDAFERALLCPDAQETYAQANLFWARLALGDLPGAKTLRADLTGLEPVGLAPCDTALTLAGEGVEAARDELERLGNDPQVGGDYAVDWARLQRLRA